MEPKVLIRAALTALALSVAGLVPGTADVSFWTSDDAKRIVASMTDSELIGQVLMLGYLVN